MSNCPKAAWNQGRTLLAVDQQKPPTSAPRGRPTAIRINQPTRNFKKSQVGGRIYCIGAGEEKGENAHAVVSGTLIVNTLLAKFLFDAGATDSFINPKTTKKKPCHLDEIDTRLCVTTPVRSLYQSEVILRDFPVIIQKRVFPADLILLGIQGYDVMLGMDWLTKYQATIDYKQKMLVHGTPEGGA